MQLPPKEQFAAYLSSKGQRFTQQMDRVVDEVFSLRGTFGGDELSTTLGGSVSRATLYRTLSKLAAAGLLRQVQLNGRTVYVASTSDDVDG